jgi:hypothetical protein
MGPARTPWTILFGEISRGAGIAASLGETQAFVDLSVPAIYRRN